MTESGQSAVRRHQTAGSPGRAGRLSASRTLLIGLWVAVSLAASASIAWFVGGRGGVEPAEALVLGLLGGSAAVAVGLLMLLVVSVERNSRTAGLEALSTASSPLLQRLMHEAPGTYVHSMAVATVAEAAAEAIGADALLCRVAAYYHDVGKIARPMYYFENLAGIANPHDSSEPKRSAELILQHVDEGVRLARRYRLPKPVREIMGQHHGTGLVRCFYVKATQEDAVVVESDYRYKGPIPQSREAAVVMLSDSCEAAVRALAVADPDTIRATVASVITDRLSDGQLAAAALQPRDLELIHDSLTRTLVCQRHDRCPYPGCAQ